jgi:hypothetical protein
VHAAGGVNVVVNGPMTVRDQVVEEARIELDEKEEGDNPLGNGKAEEAIVLNN